MLNPIEREKLRRELVRDEGLRLKPYRDTVGKLTLGVGRNLDDRGITREEAMHLLENDIDEHEGELNAALPWVRELDPVRQRVLVNMAFNLGIGGLAKFRNTLAAIQRSDYPAAAAAMRASKWASQVGARAARLAQMMETGVDPLKEQ